MPLFGRKSTAGFAAHPVFTLTAGMPRAAVVERIGSATEAKTSAEVMAELAGPGAVINPAGVDPEEYWSYPDVPDGYHLEVLFRGDRIQSPGLSSSAYQDLAVTGKGDPGGPNDPCRPRPASTTALRSRGPLHYVKPTVNPVEPVDWA